MARILTDESTLSRRKRLLSVESLWLQKAARVEAAVAVVLLMGGAALYVWKGHAWMMVAGAVLGFLSAGHFFKIRENEKERGSVAAGLKGEVTVTQTLCQALPNDCYILNDLTVRRGWHSAQIDHVVVTPRGIFLVETKNWRGRITGAEEDRRWRQDKGMGQPPVYLANPVMQNRRHVEIFRHWLRAHGVNWPDVFPVLVMMAPSAEWEIRGLTVPILRPGAAADYIAGTSGSRSYSEQDVDNVINLLMKTAR
jgi:hypothetical protein